MGSWRAALRRGEARGRVFLRSAWAVGEMLLSGRPRSGTDEGWLILPRLDGIGDFWLWLPFASALQKVFAERKIHLIANALWAELAENIGLFDRITSLYPRKLLRSLAYRQKVWTALQEAPSGILLNTTPRRRIAVEDSLAWFYPASQRQATSGHTDALEPPLLRQQLDTKLYTRIWPYPDKYLHEWQLYAGILHALQGKDLDFDIYIRLKERDWPQVNLSLPAYIVILPGASVSYKMVPFTLFVDLLRQVVRDLGLPFVFLGGMNEVPYTRQLRERLSLKESQDLTGQISLRESIAVLRGAVGVIGVDTGLTHIAATWKKPTLVLMGGGHWGRFFPYPASFPYQPFILHRPMPCYGCGWFCQYTLSRDKPYPCMTALAQASMEPFYQWLDAISARRTE